MALSLRSTRSLVLSALLISCTFLCARASAADDAVLSPSAIAQLEAHAVAAKPADQCYLFADLTHRLTELAGKQLADGQLEQAEATLRHIDSLTAKIHATISPNAHHLQDAELVMHHTTRRLADMLHISSNSERETLQATLRHLDQVHTEVLSQVFAH